MRSATLGIALGLSLAACKGDSAPAPAPSALASQSAPVPAARAVDHVDPHEVPEGTEKAFGFPIPRPMTIDTRFPDAVVARGAVPLDALANYVRARVIAERVETGPAKTVFSQATLKTSPDRMLRVEVVSFGDHAELLVRDVTRPPATVDVKPTDPWDKPGFDPKDRKVDPTRFE